MEKLSKKAKWEILNLEKNNLSSELFERINKIIKRKTGLRKVIYSTQPLNKHQLSILIFALLN